MERKAAGQQILFGLMLQLCLGLGKFSMILTIFFFPMLVMHLKVVQKLPGTRLCQQAQTRV